MKRIAQISRYAMLTAIIMMSCSKISMGQDFEGIIEYNLSGMTNATGSMTYMIQGSRMRMQMGKKGNGISAAILFLPDESSMIIIMDKMRSYMKMDVNKKMANNKYTGKWKESTMKKTGNTKTIAGHSCEIWIVTSSKDEQLIMCMAQGLGTFMSPGNPMAQNNAPDWARKVIADGYMPLEVAKITDGDKKVMMKATKIEQKSLDDSLFEIPAGYRDMSAMMQQMQKMRN